MLRSESLSDETPLKIIKMFVVTLTNLWHDLLLFMVQETLN